MLPERGIQQLDPTTPPNFAAGAISKTISISISLELKQKPKKHTSD
jgi:hypothetical protein